MSWHCVEERTADPIGRIVRKMIFTDIYENEHYAKGKIAIPKEIQLEVGKKVAYYEENDIRTGEFLCSSQTMHLSPLEIVNRMINTEEELKHFIKQNCIHAPGDCHLYGLVIHAYNYLRSKIEVEDKFDNTEIKMPKAEKLEQNELPLSPAPETHDLELSAATSGGAKTPESNGDRSSPTVAATQATLSAQANLNAANMALAIFKNAPKPRISSPINNSNNRSSKDDVETISITDDDQQQLKTERLDNSDKDNQITSSGGFSMNLGPVNQALLQAQAQNLLQHQYNQISQGGHGSINPYSTNMTPTPPKRSSINSLVETTTGKRPRLDQPTIEVSLDNLSAIGKKEALMLTKEQIEMMLRINAPEVTLVQHIVRRPDLEKYWTYIRKINVNGHQTVWTQCTKCGEVVQFKNFEVLNPTGQNRSKSGFRTKQIYSHFNSCNDQTALSYPSLALSQQLENHSKLELLKKLCQLQKHPGPL